LSESASKEAPAPLNGFLDHLRSNLQVLDESIEDSRKVPEGERPTDKRARLKLLRDLVELRGATLDRLKSHLLGLTETGSIKEPPTVFADQNFPQTLFERYFHALSEPMSLEDLKLKCDKCRAESETTKTRHYEQYYVSNDWKYIQRRAENLCDGCYDVNLQQLLADVKAAREKNGWIES